MTSEPPETPIPPAPDNPIPIRRPNKLDMKRQQIFMERMRRLLNSNPKMTEEQAMRAIQEEDYENLSLADKFKRMENIFTGALQGLGRDILQLRHNQNVIADAMDVNFRAFASALAKAGVSLEDQKKIIEDTVKAIEAEKEAAKEKDRKDKEAAEEKKMAEAILKTAEEGKDSKDTPSSPPDGAVIFGE